MRYCRISILEIRPLCLASSWTPSAPYCRFSPLIREMRAGAPPNAVSTPLCMYSMVGPLEKHRVEAVIVAAVEHNACRWCQVQGTRFLL